MSYKFQVGPAILSGSTTLIDALETKSTFAASSVSASAAVSGGSLDIGGNADIDGELDVGGLFKMADVTSGKLLIADGTSFEEVAMSGDVTIVANGTTTIGNQKVTNAMLADDAVGADELAANAVVNASIASNAAIDMDKLDGGSLASSLSDLDQGDLLYAGDITDSNNLKSITFSDFEDAIFGNVGGDATIAAGGTLTLAANSVSQVQLDDDAVGAAELASDAVVNASVQDGALKADKLDIDGSTDIGADLVDADLFIVDDGASGTNRKSTLTRMKKYVYSAVSGDATVTDSGVLSLAADSVAAAEIASSVAGDGLQGGSGTALSLDLKANTGLVISGGELAIQLSTSGSLAHGGDGVHVSLSSSGGLSQSGDGLAFDIGQVDASTVNLANDFFVFTAPGAPPTRESFLDLTHQLTNGATTGLTSSAAGVLSVDIDGTTDIGADLVDADEFLVDDGANGTNRSAAMSRVKKYIFSALSGDATATSAGELTIANDAVEQAMIAADAVGATELASDAVVNASVVDGALKADKLDIDGSTDIGADLVDADLFIVDDGAGGTNRKSALSRVKKYIFSAVGGDATASDTGELTIAAGAVQHSMLSDDIISGQTGTNTDPQDDDLMLLSDSSASNEVKKISLSNLGVYFAGGLPQPRGDANVAALSEGVNYASAAITADRTWTLPAHADLVAGDKVVVKAAVINSGVKITVAPNTGQTIDGGDPVELQEDYAAVTLVYVDTTNKLWRII